MRLSSSLAALSLVFAGAASAQDVPPIDVVFVAPTVEVEGYEPFAYDVADPAFGETLDDADLYSSITNEEIGEVDDVYRGTAGAPTYLELEIGGFLDIGDKEIIVPIDQVSVYRGTDDYRVYIEATEEQLEAYPEYED